MAYPIINAILVKNSADFCAAEAHGMATGMLCANENTDSSHWLGEVLHNVPAMAEEQRHLLLRLFEETQRLLAGDDDFEFDLLLPDDDTPLIEQIDALKSWCQGLLFGVGFAPNTGYSKDTHEILKDIVEFTKLDTDAENDNEEDKIALMELTEYLRTAVLLLRDELSHTTEH